MLARIYQPARNAMQSGQAKTKDWILEFAPESARSLDPLMGWTSSTDMNGQVKLKFSSLDAAVEYAQKHGIAYQVQQPHKRKPNVRQGGYGENFAPGRRAVWTH
ncbi:MAG TPA: ETC complex I subunit [Paracoccaceae bacterium]|nr:ETC complex I subunit [Paracoccaceae bacterium]